MKILFAINHDAIQTNLVRLIQKEGVELEFDSERDSVFSKDLIVEKVKYNLNGQERKYDIAIINEKLDGEYDLVEIVRFLSKNKIRPIVLLGNRSDTDPLIHALIKRKIYDFLYGKLKLADILNCILTPKRYEDIEYLVDAEVEEYKVQGKRIDSSDNEDSFEENIIDGDSFTGAVPKAPGIKSAGIGGMVKNVRIPSLNFPGIKDIKDAIIPNRSSENNDCTPQHGGGMPERVVVQQQYVAQLPGDYKKNIAVYSNQQVGKSFVACNLAATFASQGKKTVIVDLDFKNKSQYYYFDLSKYEQKAKSPEDMNVLAKVFQADVDNVHDLMNQMFSPMKNLYVVTSHPDLEIEHYDIDALYRVYVMLKNVFDVVIYDLPGYCGEDYLRLLMTQVEDIVIVTNQNCAVLDRTEKDLRDVLTGYFVNNKVSLIINQYIDHKEMNKGNIKDHLSVIETRTKTIEINFKNVFLIPNNYFAIVDSIAKGKPAVTLDSNLKAVFDDIANKYYPDVAYKRRG